MRRPSILIVFVIVALLALPAVAAAEPASALPAPGVGGVWHLVKYGQTLAGISRIYGVPLDAIAAVNGLVSIHAIYAGSWLWIPKFDTPPGPPPGPTCRTKYTVKRGDTLAAIGRLFGVSVWSLAGNNHITNINRIWPGQRLCIPMMGVPR